MTTLEKLGYEVYDDMCGAFAIAQGDTRVGGPDADVERLIGHFSARLLLKSTPAREGNVRVCKPTVEF